MLREGNIYGVTNVYLVGNKAREISIDAPVARGNRVMPLRYALTVSGDELKRHYDEHHRSYSVDNDPTMRQLETEVRRDMENKRFR